MNKSQYYTLDEARYRLLAEDLQKELTETNEYNEALKQALLLAGLAYDALAEERKEMVEHVVETNQEMIALKEQLEENCTGILIRHEVVAPADCDTKCGKLAEVIADLLELGDQIIEGTRGLRLPRHVDRAILEFKTFTDFFAEESDDE